VKGRDRMREREREREKEREGERDGKGSFTIKFAPSWSWCSTVCFTDLGLLDLSMLDQF
jgi:hypothetical protein